MTQTLPRLEIPARLQQLRQLLQEKGLDGFLVPSADEHLNEYLPNHRKRRQWITGFTGSAGDALVGRDKAWLLVDPRYHEQAEQEVDLSLFTLIKSGLPDQPSLMEIIEALGSGFRLGVDPFTVSVATYRQLKTHTQAGGVLLIPTSENLVDRVRQGSVPGSEASEEVSKPFTQPIYAVPISLSGATIAEKLSQVRQHMQQKRVGLLPLTKLDQVAWLFNLRGSDIPYNPVFRAYGLVSAQKTALFTDVERLTPEAQLSLQEAGVEVLPYDSYAEHLPLWARSDAPVGLDAKHTTQGTQDLLQDVACRELDHPVEALKAIKNPVELEQMRQANRKASRAKIRTLAWIDRQIQQGIPVSEADVAATMERHYREEGQWRGLSFNTIAGAGPNSSIIHYGTPNPDKLLQVGELFLLDSGSQYEGGTTDDTRTVWIGQGTADPVHQLRYTEVLKAHIQCARQIFPPDTYGASLDGITRSSLWHAGLDYGHGTGHGVGAFLNVHEGPNGIHRRANTALKVGMITSIEPGYYLPGWGGIRVENLYEVVAMPEPEGWMGFRSLTWIPFDCRLIDWGRLDRAQTDWIHRYHQQVYELHHATLEAEEAAWLKQACGLNLS
ncbi:aminopeptidase P family protein [Thermostichus vulcanus]|uniref:Aminopeptidase P family protein n=1 Tax=Thermostichus vulcanus str. 'Rupite' TaxID=2813851 RepID=A0ABT0CC57_THEVL|nr:aminopeptidase P family protein [Thermostichus vulcanus]MCJ2543363.1 aminopeptidase P family protein [Thermostichus vulcanus str. 'Rupite']